MTLDDDATTTYYFTTYSKPRITDDYKTLNIYEKTFLILYEVICTVLTILLNSYLIYVIIYKLKAKRSCVFIPILVASLLGLFHGFGCNLIMTVSLINGGWVGAMEWCGAAANIHKYIVYSIIFCQVVVSLEASYFISHPHGYSRTSRKTEHGMIVATFCAVFLDLPITVCQFDFLMPSNIESKYGDTFTDLEHYYFYDKEYLMICYRWFFKETFDYRMIVYFIHACNLCAVALVIVSYVIIISVVVNLRLNRARNCSTNPYNAERIKKSAEQTRKQNLKIALLSILTTTSILVPWLLSFVMSILVDNVDLKTLMGPDRRMDLLRLNQYMYYVVPWIFPLMNIITNPALCRVTKTLLHTFDLSAVSGMVLSKLHFNSNA